MKKAGLFLVVVVLAVLGAAPLTAQGILVEYLEGTVEYQTGNNAWVDLYIGDQIPDGARLRVDSNALVELRGDGQTVRLGRPGTYDLAAVVSSSRRTESAGVASVLRSRVHTLTQDSDRAPDTVVGGVRASEAVSRSTVNWAGGDVATLMEEGIAHLAAEEYEDALYVFMDAHDFAGSGDLAPVQFYLGYTAYLLGDVEGALAHLEATTPNPDSGYYHDHTLTLAQALIDAYAFEDARTLLTAYVSSGKAAGQDLQTAHLLTGLAFSGQGEQGHATEQLRQARQIDPDSEAGRLAAELMGSL